MGTDRGRGFHFLKIDRGPQEKVFRPPGAWIMTMVVMVMMVDGGVDDSDGGVGNVDDDGGDGYSAYTHEVNSCL